MRGQIVIELFFAVTVFFLIITWLSNYATTLYADPTAVYLQEKSVAAQFASLANTACAADVNITFSLPCISEGNQSLSYQLIGVGTPEITARSRFSNATAPTVCNAAAFIETACGTAVCIKKDGDVARIDIGAC